MVRADGGHENIWASSYNTRVLKKLLKWQADVGGESTKFATFKIKEVEAANLRVFFGMVKGDAELKILHSILKYNDFFVAQNLSGNVINFMGGRPLEVSP